MSGNAKESKASAYLCSDAKSNTERERQLASLEVTPLLPQRFGSGAREALPEKLIGATIVQLGAPNDRCGLEGGGLIIDYLPRGEAQVLRAVLEFTELGMWLTFSGEPTPVEE